MTTALWWIRRDIRLTDNQASAAARAHVDCIVTVFVLDSALLDSPYVGDKRVAFLFGGLRQLDADLRVWGSRLVVRRGEPLAELRLLQGETGATGIFAEADFSPYARRRDARVAEALPLHLTDGVIVHPPGMVLKADGTPYTVYTPFSRAWEALPLPSEHDMLVAPESLPAVPDVVSLPIPKSPTLSPGILLPPGEAEGQRRLHAFVDGKDPPISRYAQARNQLERGAHPSFRPTCALA
jgi:deoxyribodipyrimidine photo-lyase